MRVDDELILNLAKALNGPYNLNEVILPGPKLVALREIRWNSITTNERHVKISEARSAIKHLQDNPALLRLLKTPV